MTPKRKRAPGGGRKDKGYEVLGTCRLPEGTLAKIRAAQREKESIGETVARAFGWQPPAKPAPPPA